MANILLVGNGPNYLSKVVSGADVMRASVRNVRFRNQTEKIIHEPLPPMRSARSHAAFGPLIDWIRIAAEIPSFS
jgi:hypothetical protein